jgi:outer membrane protein TolC
VAHEGNWSLTLGMDVNLFDGGSTGAEVLRSRRQQYQLLEQRAKLLDDIRLEVQKYMLDMENARERIEVTRDSMIQAQENLRINRIRYQEGVGTATEVLDAVNLLTASETNYTRAIYDFRRAEAGVHYAMGKDLREVYP